MRKQNTECCEEIALDVQVAAHIRLAERKLCTRQKLLFRDIVLHVDREKRLAFANRIRLIMQLHAEASVIEALEIMNEKTVE